MLQVGRRITDKARAAFVHPQLLQPAVLRLELTQSLRFRRLCRRASLALDLNDLPFIERSPLVVVVGKSLDFRLPFRGEGQAQGGSQDFNLNTKIDREERGRYDRAASPQT